MPETSFSVEALRTRFEHSRPMTIGFEEELMLLDPESFDLVPGAPDALAAVAGDERFKLELPASQLEIVTAPCASVGEAATQLGNARTALAGALEGRYRLAGAGVHPFAAGLGVLNSNPRYDQTAREYGEVARLQLVSGLHVHVGVGGADRALSVFNALRSHLPEIAALAANAPFYGGRDSGLASVRPKLCELLPRQGVPPAMESWDALAEAFAWGAAAQRFEARQWWWEARLHPVHGTIEIRVPDTQVTVTDTAAVGSVVHSLVHHLCARHDAGETLPVAETWRIEENRWSACRYGTGGRLADLRTGATQPTADRLGALLDDLEPSAQAVGCSTELGDARALLADQGATRQREVAVRTGMRGVAEWLADSFAPKSVSGAKSRG